MLSAPIRLVSAPSEKCESEARVRWVGLRNSSDVSATHVSPERVRWVALTSMPKWQKAAQGCPAHEPLVGIGSGQGQGQGQGWS